MGTRWRSALLYVDLNRNYISSLSKSEQDQTFTLKHTILYFGFWKENKTKCNETGSTGPSAFLTQSVDKTMEAFAQIGSV